MGIAQDTIERDLALQALVAQGERANASLGELRYNACVVGDASLSEYADAVGVSRQAIHISISLYARANGLSSRLDNSRSEAQRQRRETERQSPATPTPRVSNEAIDTTLAMAAQLVVLSRHLTQQPTRPTEVATGELKEAATAAITELQALLAYLEGH